MPRSQFFNLQAYLDVNGAMNTNQNRSDLQHSIVASGRIRATDGFDVESDERIKTGTQTVSTADALAMIGKLRPVDYTFVDQVTRGQKTQRGFLAQEVKKELPGAITEYQEFVPSIFAPALSCAFDEETGLATIKSPKPHDLVAGDTVRLILESGKKEFAVETIDSPQTFSLLLGEDESPFEEAFIFGKRVDDFHSVDYDRVFTTGIAAIQGLKAEKDAEVKSLKEELQQKAGQIEALQARLTQLETLGQTRDAKISSIEKLLKNQAQSISAPVAKVEGGRK